jgi:DNA-directed RNA polymerase subunit RPC12/RpoP
MFNSKFLFIAVSFFSSSSCISLISVMFFGVAFSFFYFFMCILVFFTLRLISLIFKKISMGHYHTSSPENGKNYKRHVCIICGRRVYEKFMLKSKDSKRDLYRCRHCAKKPD